MRQTHVFLQFNTKSYALCRMVTSPMTLNNYLSFLKWHLGPRLTRGSFLPPESISRTAPQSVQPFVDIGLMVVTIRYTVKQRDHGTSVTIGRILCMFRIAMQPNSTHDYPATQNSVRLPASPQLLQRAVRLTELGARRQCSSAVRLYYC